MEKRRLQLGQMHMLRFSSSMESDTTSIAAHPHGSAVRAVAVAGNLFQTTTKVVNIPQYVYYLLSSGTVSSLKLLKCSTPSNCFITSETMEYTCMLRTSSFVVPSEVKRKSTRNNT